VRAFVIAGNDDAAEVDEALASGTRMRLAEGHVNWIDDWLPMISYGDSTPTPWDSPREVSEEEYGQRLDAMIAELDDPGRAVFNLHVPPYDTQIDMAPALDAELRVRYSTAGDMLLAPVGSQCSPSTAMSTRAVAARGSAAPCASTRAATTSTACCAAC
jgi:Icc-related predicted phosphoesterase